MENNFTIDVPDSERKELMFEVAHSIQGGWLGKAYTSTCLDILRVIAGYESYNGQDELTSSNARLIKHIKETDSQLYFRLRPFIRQCYDWETSPPTFMGDPNINGH